MEGKIIISTNVNLLFAISDTYTRMCARHTYTHTSVVLLFYTRWQFRSQLDGADDTGNPPDIHDDCDTTNRLVAKSNECVITVLFDDSRCLRPERCFQYMYNSKSSAK